MELKKATHGNVKSMSREQHSLFVVGPTRSFGVKSIGRCDNCTAEAVAAAAGHTW